MTYDAAGDARKTTAVAISSGSPTRPTGIGASRRRRVSGSAPLVAVRIAPGATAFTRMSNGRELEGSGSSERLDPALRRVVGGQPAMGPMGAERADVDDGAGHALGDQPRGDGPRAQEDARQVRADDLVPVLGRLIEQPDRRVGKRRVVDQHVDGAEGIARRPRPGARRRPGCPTSAATARTSPRDRSSRSDGRQGAGVAPVDDDPGAGIEQRRGDRAADPARRTGHQGDAAIQGTGRSRAAALSHDRHPPARTVRPGRSPTPRAAARRSESGRRRRRSPTGRRRGEGP